MDKSSYKQGEFSWADLGTTDVPKAKAFYGELFGWELVDEPAGPDMVYTMARIRGKDVCALYQMRPEEAKMAPPHWNVYVAVDDVDATASKAKQLGGQVLMAPFDVMEHGRMCIVMDPSGATLCYWQKKGNPGAAVYGDARTLCWAELNTKDLDKARSFYTALLGWGVKVSPDYSEWTVGSHSVGGLMKQTPEMGDAPPHWLQYFAVESCEESAARATKLGGQLYVPPMAIPNVGSFAVIADPTGAVFAIYQRTGGH